MTRLAIGAFALVTIVVAAVLGRSSANGWSLKQSSKAAIEASASVACLLVALMAVAFCLFDVSVPLFAADTGSLTMLKSLIPQLGIVTAFGVLGSYGSPRNRRWQMFGTTRAAAGCCVVVAAVVMWLSMSETALGILVYRGLALGLGWGEVSQGLRVAVTLTAVALTIVEELFFRWALFNRIESRSGGGRAVVVTTIVFALFHADHGMRGFVSGVVAGSLLGLCRWKTGGLFAPIGVHLAWNLVAGAIRFRYVTGVWLSLLGGG